MYRGIILELVQSLKEIEELEEAALYSNLDFVWNFCEIIFLSSNPGTEIIAHTYAPIFDLVIIKSSVAVAQFIW